MTMSTVQSIQRRLQQLEESITTLTNAQLSFTSDMTDLISRVLQLVLISVKRTKDGLFNCRHMSCGVTSFTVFVGHAVNKKDKVWQQLCRTQVFKAGRHLAH